MRSDLLALLRDPVSGEELELDVFESRNGEISRGLLRNRERWYPILDGVPRMLLGEVRGDYGDFIAQHGLSALAQDAGSRGDAGVEQRATNETFSDKWTRFKQYGFDPEHREFLHQWFAEKFGLESPEQLPGFYARRRAILEIGPGSGFNTQYMADHTDGLVVSVDISDAALTTYDNTRDRANVHVVQADLMQLPCADDHFDFAIADGVLHHTPDTRSAVEAVYRKVAPGGQFFFYVYRKMGAARYFVDQHIREAFSPLDPEECYRACEGITELGRELSRLDARIELERGVPILGIPPGTHNVQRLLYYNFLKCFWNDAFDWETNNMVNFDWYHPHNAWQHSEEEVASWLEQLGVEEYSFNPANPNGISCLLRKPA